jgi:hypothetical protein
MESTTSASSSEWLSRRVILPIPHVFLAGEYIDDRAVKDDMDRPSKFLAKLCRTVLLLGEKGY